MIIQNHGIWQGGKAFTPGNLNLLAWYRGDDITIGGGIFTWIDKTGNGFNLPTTIPYVHGSDIITNVGDLNGHDTYSYTLNNDAQNNSQTTITGVSTLPFTVWSVIRNDDTGASYPYGFGNTNRRVNFTANSHQYLKESPSATTTEVILPDSMASYQLLRETFNVPSAVIEQNDHGESIIDTTGFAVTDVFTLNEELATNPSATTYAEIIIMSGTPTAQEIQNIKDYIEVRYGITM